MTRTLIEGYFRVLRFTSVFCLTSMTVLVFANVVLRYGFNAGIAASEELSRWLFVWLTFLGAILVLREQGHLGVDILVNRLAPRVKRVCLGVCNLLMLFATWLLIDGSWKQMLLNLNVGAPVTGLSLALFYGVGVFFGMSATLILLHNLYRLSRSHDSRRASIR